MRISDTKGVKMVLYLVNYRSTFKLPCIVAAADPTEKTKTLYRNSEDPL